MVRRKLRKVKGSSEVSVVPDLQRIAAIRKRHASLCSVSGYPRDRIVSYFAAPSRIFCTSVGCASDREAVEASRFLMLDKE